ncbi:PH domain-containing protein [Yimella sp. NH-Cas1]|uniref:PH domain-containing protein n=1 Tax=Yimella sp. NH-Cas1 TaxID=2917726 RepID=UPI001EFA6045|nr:PH domain-containing protein [Yimella sp. NH-Cas1]MCG8656195.1 PH domain-containing protein [Yimella sp. NH-Cas1]
MSDDQQPDAGLDDTARQDHQSLPPTPPQNDAGEWSRLDPRMLLIHPFREIGRAIPLLVGALFAGRNLGGGTGWLWPVVGTVLVVLFGVLRWFTTTYRFTPEHIQLRTGLFERSTLAAATDKVRTVDVTAPLLHRLVGLATVEIGTGAGDKPVKLDGLPASEAARLRADLLQRRRTPAPNSLEHEGAGSDTEENAEGAVPRWVSKDEADEVLYRFEPKWLLYAPLGLAGFATAGAVLGVLFQTVDQLNLWPSDDSAVNDAWTRAENLGVFAIIAVAGLLFLAVVSLLAVVGAAISNFGFTLGRDVHGRTLHLQRGLFTTRSTSLETQRLRGVEVQRPILLRRFGGARLTAIVTGFSLDADAGQRAVLAPSSPYERIVQTGNTVLRGDILDGPLRRHGSAATRRRYIRSIVPASVLAVGLVVGGHFLGRIVPAIVLAVLLVLASILLGRSRAHWLGHAVVDDHLVTRSGSLAMSTAALDLDATAAVTVRRSFFQRRAGLASVEVALGAGRQGYRVTDLADHSAEELTAFVVNRAMRR